MDDPVARESSRDKRARARGTFTPTKAEGYNRKQRHAIAAQAVKNGKAELLAKGCDLAEAKRALVNPKRVSVAQQIRQVWKDRAELRRLEREQKRRRLNG